MKKVFENVMSCEDMQELKACLQIMIESCEIGMNNSAMLEMMKQIQGEVSGCNYDEVAKRQATALSTKSKDIWCPCRAKRAAENA